MIWNAEKRLWLPGSFAPTRRSQRGAIGVMAQRMSMKPITRTFNPPITANLGLYLRGDTATFSNIGGTTPCTDGQAVLVWNDQSGGSHNLSNPQDGGAIWKASQINGLGIVRFDLTHHGYYNVAGLDATATSTTYVVLSIPSANYGTIWTSGANNVLAVELGGAANLVLTRENNAGIAAATSSPTLGHYSQQNVTWNNTTKAYGFRMNGAANGSGTAVNNATSFAVSEFGASLAGGGPLLADMAAILIYTTVHNSTQIAQMEAWINTWWGPFS